MKLSEVKSILKSAESVDFQLESGSFVPENFHVTEVGIITKDFIDCGGTVRTEKVANFQLWDANDFDHRLKPSKLISIIGLSERILGMEDLEVEVEYQSDTIGKYDLDFNGKNFILQSKKTACLAMDSCGTPKPKILVSEMANEVCCTPGGGCC